MNWYDWTYDHLDELIKSGSKESKALVALFLLDGEFGNGGLIQYIMNSSGDSWAALADAFELGDCKQGVDWMESVESILGGVVLLRDRDARIDAISITLQFQKGEDPFDKPDAVLRDKLISEFQRVGEKLVALCIR
jgi:hypothetical protein